MTALRSLFPDICTHDVKACVDFYAALFGFRPVFQADWYAQLVAPENPSLQIAFVEQGHGSVPEGHGLAPRGVLVTLEVDDVDALHARALELGHAITYALKSEVWGQRHFMLLDPNGLLVDVVQLIPPSQEFLEEHGLA
ncbi:MAG TPA: VOC family protein [Polyangiaceae bacterium]|nr:VOC family protein [Polyangiaceae bacterium]